MEIDLPIYESKGYWEKSGSPYADVHDAVSGTWESDGDPLAAQYYQDSTYYIYRKLFTVPMVDCIEPTITEATVIGNGHLESSDRDIKAVLVDASDVTIGDSGYGDMKDKTTDYGHLDIPEGTDGDYDWEIPISEAGLALLEGYGMAQLGIRLDQDISATAPNLNERQEHGGFPSHIHIVCSTFPRRYAWVYLSGFYYVDAWGSCRWKVGDLTGLTGKNPAQISINTKSGIDGTKFCYIDNDRKERCIEGDLTGLTGKTPSQISINTKSGIDGTKFCYIDATGAERCFKGASCEHG